MTGRSIFRVLRWVGLAAVAPALWACNARSLEKPVLTPEQTYGKTFQQTINRNVDMLFLVDDSSSMRLSQDNLNRNFPTFMTRLMDPPGLPNIHVAVISSDMGAGDGSVASCDSTGGKNGIFQYTARGSCTSTGLQAGATYISDIGGVRNYTGNLSDTPDGSERCCTVGTTINMLLCVERCRWRKLPFDEVDEPLEGYML